MKRKLLYLSTFIAAIIIIFKTVVFANSGGAQYGFAGAPDDLAPDACGTGGCHNFIPIQNDPSFKITMFDPSGDTSKSYKLNVKYVIRVELTRASLKDCGFEATVETANGNVHIGKYAPKIKSQLTFGNPNYVTHSTYLKTSTGYGKWEFYWTSPKADPGGDIIVYAAGNDGNDSDNAGGRGDSIFTTTKTFSHNAGIANAILDEATVNVFPNPAKDDFTINYGLKSAQNVNIDLYDIKGQFVSHIQNGFVPQGSQKVSANIRGVVPGIYYVNILVGDETAVRKLLVE